MEKYKFTGLHTPRIPEVDSSSPSHGLLRNRSISNKNSKYFPARLLSRSQTTIERGNPKIIKTTISREFKYFFPKIHPQQFPHSFSKKSQPAKIFFFVDCHHFCHHFHFTHNNHSRGFPSSGQLRKLLLTSFSKPQYTTRIHHRFLKHETLNMYRKLLPLLFSHVILVTKF